jgi:Zn-dependent protease with chaperone function
MLPAGDSGGFLLSLVTESFAVRALLGSLAATGLAAILVGLGAVRTSRARRLVLLAPAVSATAAGVASIGEVYLPQIWVATTAAAGGGTSLEFLAEQLGVVTERGVDALMLGYAVFVLLLLGRRGLGLLQLRRLLQSAVPASIRAEVAEETARLARTMGTKPPNVVLLRNCPGGAFTIGTLRPLIAVDPALLDELDKHELEGLLAHELAHVARRDTLLGTVVGLCRDLAFFLPPLHMAERWLRREQEESADELASRHTGRPVALASSILKVWTSSRSRPQPTGVCAAIPGRVALPSGILVGGPRMGDPFKVITARVERLIARVPAPSVLRHCAEVGLAAVVLAVGTSAALSLPRWIATDLGADSLSFVYLSAAPSAPVESAAFATFRALTPPPRSPDVPSTSSGRVTTPSQQSAAQRGCPCIESQAQWESGVAATGRGAPRRLAWGSDERPVWDMSEPNGSTAVRTARPLMTLGDTGPQVGFFVVSRAAE